jgi:hypothetical protein
LKRILADRECVRYPCEIAFDAGPLQPGECAYPMPLGERPEDGFRICVHPYFLADPDRVPLLALYQIVPVNYGSFASPDDAEAFGAAVLGITRDGYYAALCAMADEISEGESAAGETGRVGCGCDGAQRSMLDDIRNTCAQLPKECRECEPPFGQNGR